MPPDTPLPRRLRPRRSPVQERSQLTVDSIVEAAIQVFERHGYAAGTTARIAERCGISVGSLYQYFPNKDAILVAVALRHLAEGEAMLAGLLREPVAGPPPLDAMLRGWVEAMVELHAGHPALHRMLFEQVALPPAVWAAVGRLERTAVEHLTGLLAARPDVAVADPRLAAQLVVELIEAATHRLVLHPPARYSRERCVDELVRLLVAYLRHS
ncbi:MAG TPA: TetR/AcrR family transcriptional regulator [Chloroflexaceae bacterium]|nr:TetR/AcrR family transcriptional regulator [Chloroflexaceae bacterium]